MEFQMNSMQYVYTIFDFELEIMPCIHTAVFKQGATEFLFLQPNDHIQGIFSDKNS